VYQLSLFGQVDTIEQPNKCSRCSGELRFAHPSFTLVSRDRGFYEVSCKECKTAFRLYRNRDGNPDWKLIKLH